MRRGISGGVHMVGRLPVMEKESEIAAQRRRRAEKLNSSDPEVVAWQLAVERRKNAQKRAKRAAETPEQREERLAKRRRQEAERRARPSRQQQQDAFDDIKHEHSSQGSSATGSQRSSSSGSTPRPCGAREAEAKRARRQANPELRAREAEERRARRQADPEAMGQNLADHSRHKSVTAVSTTVVHGDAAMQRDRRADVADKSTCCEEGTSKSTQAELFTRKVSRWTQCDDLEESYGASPQPELPQPSKAMFIVLSNSRRSDSGVQEEVNVDDVTEGYGRPSADADAAFNDDRASSLTVNGGSAAVAYSCRLCSLKFIELDALASHVLTCPWPEPFQCSLCLETCMDWRAIRHHLASHINKDTQKCPFCEQTLDRKRWTIMRHMQRQHVNVKAFMCNFCWAAFVMKQDILIHSRRCRAKVDKHLRLTEKRNSPAHIHPYTYQCSICSDTFVNILVAACHMQVHMNEMQHDQADEQCLKC